MLAARAAGLTDVIVPERNGPDLDDVPSDVRDHMRFHLVGSVDQVLTLALEDKELALAASAFECDRELRSGSTTAIDARPLRSFCALRNRLQLDCAGRARQHASMARALLSPFCSLGSV